MHIELEGVALAVNASISDRRGPDYGDGERRRETDALPGDTVLERFAVHLGTDE